MKIELLYIRDCPNRLPTVQTVKDILRESGLRLDIAETEIGNAAQAAKLSFLGSPTVRVDGEDVEPGAVEAKDYGVSCRSYLVNGRRQGTPDPEWIRQAIRGAHAK